MMFVSLCVESIDMRADKRVGVCLQELLCIITPPGVRGRVCHFYIVCNCHAWRGMVPNYHLNLRKKYFFST